MLVFFNVGRLIRADRSHGQHAPFVLPSAEEIATVLEMAAEYGVIVATIDPPDIDGRTIRSRDTKRGMALGGRPGRQRTRPTPRVRRQVVELFEAGESVRAIAGKVGQSWRQVEYVVSAHRKGGD
ncbi:MAG: hypothetical protein WD557_18745 [Dehalococcoidia bacterium]